MQTRLHNTSELAPWREVYKATIADINDLGGHLHPIRFSFLLSSLFSSFANLIFFHHKVTVQLATVRPDGIPVNRTVVFSNFAGENDKNPTEWESDLVCFTADTRTDKISHIQTNPIGDICWFVFLRSSLEPWFEKIKSYSNI